MSQPIYVAETACTLAGSTITLSGSAAFDAQTFAQANDAAGMPLQDGKLVTVSIYDVAAPAWALWRAVYDRSAGTLTISGVALQEEGTLGANGLLVAVSSNDYLLDAVAESKTSTPVAFAFYNTAEDDDPNWIYGNGQSWHAPLGDFPRLALLVVEDGFFTIYDATDPELPVWWQLASTSGSYIRGTASAPMVTVAAKNGMIYVGASNNGSSGRFGIMDMVEDWGAVMIHTTSQFNYQKIYDHESPPHAGDTTTGTWPAGLVNRDINAIALTILPNTPIDPIRNMRTPTVAVATDGGVSIIHADWTVTDSSWTGVAGHVAFSKDADLAIGAEQSEYLRLVRAGNYDTDTFATDVTYTDVSVPALLDDTEPTSPALFTDRVLISASDNGLSLLRELIGDEANSAVAYITSDYNTGWMFGDIKLSALASAIAETLGVDESTELATNGGFDTDTGYTKGTNWTISGGKLNATSVPQYSFTSQSISLVEGAVYTATIDADSITSGSFKLYHHDGTSYGNYAALSAGGDNTFTFRATASNQFRIYVGAGGGTAVFDNFSVKRTGNLIENGDFTYNTEGWAAANDAVLSVSSNRLRVTNNVTNYGQGYQSFATVVGETYTATIDVFPGTSGNVRVDFGTGIGNTSSGTQNSTSDASLEFTFVAVGTTTYLTVLCNSTGDTDYVEVDNVSVRLADPDRSVNGDGLEVHGQITKTAVATGADLMKYRPISDASYLRTTDNPLATGGDGDFHILFWAFPDDVPANRYFFDLADSVGGTRLYCILDSSEQLNVGGAVSSSALPVGEAVFISLRRVSDVLYLDINGVNVDSGAWATHHDGVNVYVTLFDRYDFTSTTAGDMSLFRIGAGAPSADDIRAFYEDEKHLFANNAKCTLPGSSDVVNALAYNEWKNQLHVGTGAGKAIFKGLVNVEEDLTAAVTVIDALGENEVTD